MPTRSRRPPPELVEKWIKRGYGCGQGAAYKPFLAVRDVPSEGTSSMVSSRLTGRVVQWINLARRAIDFSDRSSMDRRAGGCSLVVGPG